MNFLKTGAVLLLAARLGFGPILAQPILNQQNSFQNPIGSGIANLRVTTQNPDKTEALLTMDYSYDGFAGPTALVVPSIEKKGQKGVSVWFGADPVTIGQGKGVISIKVKYFNDEPGVPAMFTSDRLSVLILNRQASAILSRIPFLKTIKWGSADAKPAPVVGASPANLSALRAAEQKHLAEDQARAARLAREAELAEQKRVASQGREEARLKARAEEQARLATEAETKTKARAAAELQFHEEARLKTEANAKRLAEETRAAAEKARIEADARRLAEQLAKKELDAKATAAAPPLAPPVSLAAAAVPALEIAPELKSKVTNVEIVQRSLDRSQMTIGVEYEYKNDFNAQALLGVDVLRLAEPQVADFFHSPRIEIGKSRRNFMLFPVKFQPPGSLGSDGNGFSTDKVLVYLTEAATGKRFNLFPAAALLVWHVPGAAASAIAPGKGSSIEFDNFQQNDPSSGYVTVKYNSPNGSGILRVRVFDDSDPRSAEWFNTQTLEVKQGRGVQILDVKVEPESTSPTAIFKANTIEIELVDGSGKAIAKVAKRTTMTWAKPK